MSDNLFRPGTIGGYQPVYIVAAAPQGNPGAYAANGKQILVIIIGRNLYLLLIY